MDDIRGPSLSQSLNPSSSRKHPLPSLAPRGCSSPLWQSPCLTTQELHPGLTDDTVITTASEDMGQALS